MQMWVPSYTGHFQAPYVLGLPAKHGYIYCVGIAPATWQPPSLQWAAPISSSAMEKCSHPSSLHLQLSHPKAQPPTRCSWQSRGIRSELPVWCWGLVTRLFVCLSLPCLCCAHSPGVPLCLAACEQRNCACTSTQVRDPPSIRPPGLAGVRVTWLDVAVEDQLSWPRFPFALTENKTLIPTKTSCLNIFT